MNFYRASVGESPSAAWRERTADSVRKYIFRKGRSKGLSFTPASPSSPWRKRRKTGTRFGVSVFWWTIKGSFSRELRARSSAALTGLAAARSRSGSDSTLCCHSLPSRRYATLCCHSLPLPLRTLAADGEKRAPAAGCPFFWWTIKGSFSRELRARSSAALTVRRTVIHSRFPFEPLTQNAKNGHPLRGVRFLVDHQGLVLARTARSVFRGSDSTLCCHSLPLPLRALSPMAKKRAPAAGCPFFWWTIKGSNLGPTGYEPVALTN